MRTSSDPPAPPTPAPRHGFPFVRLTIAGVILLVEYLALSFAFDAKLVASRGGIWTVLGQAGNIGPIVVAGATALLLVPRLRGVVGSAATSIRPNLWLFLLHLAVAAAFAFVTSLAFGKKDPPAGPAIIWMVGWALLGASTAASLLVGMLGDWRWLARTLGRAALVGGGLGFAAWLGGSVSTELWAPLSRATFVVVSNLLQQLGYELHYDAATVTLELERFSVAVDSACSGFEGIGLFAVLFSGFLYQLRERLVVYRAIWLLPLGIVAVWFGNALRIAGLMIVGVKLDPSVALGSFHSKAGWVFFAGITLGFAVLARKVPYFTPRSTVETAVELANPTAPLLVPMLSWMGIGLVTSAFVQHHDPLYGLRVVGASLALYWYRHQLAEWLQRPTWMAWVAGTLVGVVWLAVPLDAASKALNSSHPWPEWSVAAMGAWITLRCLGSIVLVPICEELAFRGYLARFVTRRDFWQVPLTRLTWLGILVSSLVFGAMHGRWILGATTGVVFALLVRRTGRLMDAIVAHGLSNLMIAIWVLATGDWRRW